MPESGGNVGWQAASSPAAYSAGQSLGAGPHGAKTLAAEAFAEDESSRGTDVGAPEPTQAAGSSAVSRSTTQASAVRRTVLPLHCGRLGAASLARSQAEEMTDAPSEQHGY